MSSKKWLKVGSIRKSEAGKLYIKFHGQSNKDGGLSMACLKGLADRLNSAGKDGIALQIEKPADSLRRLCELGHIEEDALEGRIEAIPEWLKYEITLPPDNS